MMFSNKVSCYDIIHNQKHSSTQVTLLKGGCF